MSRASWSASLSVGLAAFASSGCASRPGGLETLDATLWMQSSVEYAAVALQSYRNAAEQLDLALSDTAWSALLERTSGVGTLPPAVILDVDETVLDNSAYAARLIREGRRYEAASWSAWVEEASAPAVPGAIPFLRTARDRGVTVVFVTNRDALLEEATRRNLARVGFPPDTVPDVVLMRHEIPEWGSDKSSRRQHVAAGYRVLLLVGDDFNDFLPAHEDLATRREMWNRHSERWGRSWIALPNPTYGSWESALTDHERELPERERLQRKFERLDPGT
ncbi:MAG: HAD family acid phosphatase [Gemmatimonadota bacterium]